jgi:hypothetical protein
MRPACPNAEPPNIISHEHLRKRHNIISHNFAIGQPIASDAHDIFILVMYNNPPHLQTLPGEFTSLLAYKGVGPTPIDTTLWHQRLGYLGRDTMTLDLRSVHTNGAKCDSHVPSSHVSREF